MAWLSTDTDVACTLTVHKEIRGVVLPGYPKTYSILSAFSSTGSYPALTENDWSKTAAADRTARIEAFKAYVNSVEVMSVDDVEMNTEYQPSAEIPGVIVEL